MKQKVFMVMFIMTFCVCGMHAQNIDNEVEEYYADTVPKTTPKSDNYEEFSETLRQFKALLAEKKTSTDDYKNVFFPVEGKSKFMRRHHTTQRLEMSVIGGSDNGEDSPENTSREIKGDITNKQEYDEDKYQGKVNFGLNVGYSLVFVPGRIEGNKLRINKFGFGYSLGMIAAFDRQDHYGVTCDFLGKIGIEAGNGHQMGVGVDFLLGSGKSCGNFYYLLGDTGSDDGAYDTDDLVEPYTAWCLKTGTQLWVRSNILKANLSNTDIRLFARYVYSVNPHKGSRLSDINLIDYWMEESWQFGFTCCYSF